MRFKFRAYDPNMWKMHSNIGMDQLHLYNFPGDNITEQEGLVIMQWTGEKEIYEDDIVRQGKNIGVVKYSNEYCRFYVDWLPPVEFGLRSELWYVRDDLEVIGNIYEHPSLIGRTATDSTEILSESEAE